MFQCSNAFAWTPPQSPPPQDNVPQPLNTGPTGQAKEGSLTVGKNIVIPGTIFGAYNPSTSTNFVFTTDGKIGIGTYSPSYELDVFGEVRFSDILTGTAFYNGIYFVSPGSSDFSLDVLGSIRAIGTTNDNYLAGNLGIGISSPDGKIEVRQTGTADIFNLYDDTTNVLTVLDGGNVGIGISTPTGLLDVNNNFIVSNEQIIMNVPLNLAAAGDISIASDLQFTNPTASYIKSYAPLYLEAGDNNHNYDLVLRAFNAGEVVSDAQLNLSNNRITNLAPPINDTDAVTKGYVSDMEYWQVTDSYLYPSNMDYNVGIGISNPSVDLEVYDSAGPSEILLSSDTDEQSMIYFEDGQTGIYEPGDNSEDLRFWTGSTDRLTIASGGNIGIGTIGPLTNLQISGAYSGSQYGQIYIDSVAGPAGIVLNSASGQDNFMGFRENGIYKANFGWDASDNLFAFQTRGESDIKFLVDRDGTEDIGLYILGTNGDVGIGTTVPRGRLDIGDGDIYIGNHPTQRKLYFGNTGNYFTRGAIHTTQTNLGLYNNYATGYVTLNTVAGEGLRLDENGDVGIGTTSPGAKLTVGDDAFMVTDTGTVSAGTWQGDNIAVVHGGTGTSTGSITGSGPGALTFAAGGTNENVILTPSGTGNTLLNGDVGIGTSIPRAKLDIEGGNIYIDDFNGGTADDKYAATVGYVKETSNAGVTGSPNYISKYGTDGILTETATPIYELNDRIGIGTADPQYILDVRGDIAIGAPGATNRIHFVATPEVPTDVTSKEYVDDLFTGKPGEPGAYWSKTATGDHIYNNNTGYVGVGTPSPLIDLDVLGSVDISNQISAGSAYIINDIEVATGDLLVANGSVGIGTSIPSSKLHVDGISGTPATANALMNLRDTASNIGFQMGATSGYGWIRAVNVGVSVTSDLVLQPNNLTNVNRVGIGVTSPIAKLHIKPATDAEVFRGEGQGGELVVIDKDGKMGIGTAAPGAKLHLRSSGGANSGVNLEITSASSYGTIDFNTPSGLSGQLITTGSSYSNGMFIGDQMALASYLINGKTTLVAAGDNGYINFVTGGNQLANERMRITSTGDVAVGTTSAGYKLDILSPDDTDSFVRVQRYDGEVQTGVMLATGASTPLWSMYVDGGSAEDLLFEHNGDVPFMISDDNKVGIGTDNPRSKLHISEDGVDLHANVLTGTAPTMLLTGGGQNIISTIIQASSSATQRPILQFRKARGTLSSPLPVVNGDQLASFGPGGYSGSSMIFTSMIDFYVDGAVTSTVVPQRISFVTGTTEGNRTERLVIKSDGKIGVGVTDPDSRLEVKGAGTGSGTYGITVRNSNDTVALMVRDDGNVGIGTTIPSVKLDIDGGTGQVVDVSGGRIMGLNLIPLSDSEAVPRVYIHENFAPLAGGEPGGTGDAFVQDGNSFGSLATLGTNDSYDLTFETNNTRQVTIDTDGNVGIGTANPGTYKLNVWGDLSSDEGNLYTESGVLTTDSFRDIDSVLYYLDPASTTWGLYTQGSIFANGTAEDNYFAGNVNIDGDLTPATITMSGIIDTTSTIDAGEFTEDGSPTLSNDISGDAATVDSHSIIATIDNIIVRHDGVNLEDSGILDVSDARAITIDSDEEVGIGTTSPQDKLHIYGDYVTFDITGVAANRILATADSTGRAYWKDLNEIGGVGGVGNGQANYITKWSDANTVTKTTTPIYELDNKIGVGTITPSAKLQVKAAVAEVIVNFTDDDGTNVMQIDANGNVIISL